MLCLLPVLLMLLAAGCRGVTTGHTGTAAPDTGGVAMAVPYPAVPDFATDPFALGPGGEWGTGLVLADMDGNGYPDLVVSAGNDKANQHVVIYFNYGSNKISTSPGWVSQDTDHHGTLAVGDIDGNGWPDIAVSVFLGQDLAYEGGGVKVYYNYGPPNYLERTPSFKVTGFPSYGCALGDINGDGRLDLAVAGGEPIPEVESFATQECGTGEAEAQAVRRTGANPQSAGQENPQAGGTQEPPYETPGRIYLNVGGRFYENAVWKTDDAFVAMAVDFADANYDGLMDVIFQSAPVRIYLGSRTAEGASLSTAPDWVSTDANYYGNGFDYAASLQQPANLAKPSFSLATSSNSYMGQGRGGFSLYRFLSPFVIQYKPRTSAPNWQSRYGDWGSGVRLADVDNDGNLDMLTHRWNTPGFNDLKGRLLLFQGNGGLFTTDEAVWQSDASSIIETIQVADLDRAAERWESQLIRIAAENWSPGQTGQSMVYLQRQVIAAIDEVRINGVLCVAGRDYITVPGRNWISFAKPLLDKTAVTVRYRWSPELDVVYTNWNCDLGNYVYFHR